MMTPSISGVRRAVLLAWCAVMVGGCGGERLVKVSGTVTRHGKPVPNLGVHFVPEKGLASHGLTDAEGRFVLLYSTGTEGAAVGTHKVWVQLPTDPAKRLELQRRAKEPDMEALLLKY